MIQPETLDIGEVTLHLRNVTLPMGLIVDDVRVYGKALHLVREPMAVSMPGAGRLEVVVSAGSLSTFLDGQAPGGLKDFRIETKEDRLHVKATKVVLLPIQALAICRLRIEDGTKLFVDLESVEVAGGASIRTLVQTQLAKLNPILDANLLPFVKARMNEVQVANGQIILKGQVEPI